ncbi:MAG: hypothetical protein V4506_05050 [Bacteroidota bacterium]
MKNKKLLFFVILLFPALFKIILEFTTINSKKLPYYGPKELAGKDTVYYKVTSEFKTFAAKASADSGFVSMNLDTVQYPLFAVCFIKPAYKSDNYRLAGLSEYAQYKKEKIKHIPFVIVTPSSGPSDSTDLKGLDKLQVGNPNILTLHWDTRSFDSLNVTFFKAKPVYIDYSFFVLVDKNRHIRGYYDARYVSEIKRLTEEYQHMRLKEEKEKVIKINQIESK